MRITKYIFVFCCETGLRYSDALDLRWEHINEDMSAIQKIQVKTEREVYIPISNQAKAIMVMYKNRHKDSNGYVFPRIDNQVMNRYLKEIAQIAGIKKNLTTHVARHTFGTRLGATGIVSPFTICELMGHSDIAMTQRYVNLSKDDLKTTMNKVWGAKQGLSTGQKIINVNTNKYETNRQSF
jgi:integrase